MTVAKPEARRNQAGASGTELNPQGKLQDRVLSKIMGSDGSMGNALC